MNEPIYLRLVRAFFVATEVDNNNFTLKASLKGTEILILEQLLAIMLGVLVDSSRLYDDWFEMVGLRKKKIQKKFLEYKDEYLKSKSLTSFGRIVH